MFIKNKQAIEKMKTAGRLLAEIFENIHTVIEQGRSTESIDTWIAQELKARGLVSQSMGYHGYAHVSCISVNDVVVHGVPSSQVVLQQKDLVKVDVCAAWQGYCADMARMFIVGNKSDEATQRLVAVTWQALDAGIAQAVVGNRLYDISAAVQACAQQAGYGIVRDFAGHGIGQKMHEQPDVPNFGIAGTGMRLQEGMTFAIEPMITQGAHQIVIDPDGWTARTKDGKLAAHVEDTVLVGPNGPEILTRL